MGVGRNDISHTTGSSARGAVMVTLLLCACSPTAEGPGTSDDLVPPSVAASPSELVTESPRPAPPPPEPSVEPEPEPEPEFPTPAEYCEDLILDVLEVSASDDGGGSPRVLQIYRSEVVDYRFDDYVGGELVIPEDEVMVRLVECEGIAALSSGEDVKIRYYTSIDLNDQFFTGYEFID